MLFLRLDTYSLLSVRAPHCFEARTRCSRSLNQKQSLLHDPITIQSGRKTIGWRKSLSFLVRSLISVIVIELLIIAEKNIITTFIIV
jgi:hypothetical protein